MDKIRFAHLVFHKSKPWIAVFFPKDRSLISRFRSSYPEAIWSRTLATWLIPDSSKNRLAFSLSLNLHLYNQMAEVSFAPKLLCETNYHALLDYHKELILRAYSPNTVKLYESEFSRYLEDLGEKEVRLQSESQIKAYLFFLRDELSYTEAHLHSTINAIKFFHEKVMGKPRFSMALPRPKKREHLPSILFKGELKRLFHGLDNIKHRVILMTMFSSGLSVSELINLHLSDIDSERMTLHIRQAKGKKDRVVHLSQVLLEELRSYVRQYRPKLFLFEGQTGGKYSVRSVQAVMKKAKDMANIIKPGSTHSLRHAYATHLLESGVDIRFIQELMGHKNIKTTMIYTKVAKGKSRKIPSPLDEL